MVHLAHAQAVHWMPSSLLCRAQAKVDGFGFGRSRILVSFASSSPIMKIISPKTIDKAMESMDSMNDQDLKQLVEVLAEEQPALMAFLLSQDEDFSEADFDNMVHLALIVFQCFKLEFKKMRTLEIEEVEEFANAQISHFQKLEEMSDVDLEIEMANTLTNAKQPFLLECITEELAVLEEEGLIEDESGAAYFFPTLQLVIDLLDAAANSSYLRIVK